MNEDLLLLLLLGSLTVGLLIDAVAPLRRPGMPRWFRWINNGVLFLINGLVTRLIVPGGLLAIATWTMTRQWGVLNQATLPGWLELLLGVLLLDLVTYSIHRVSHRAPLLWRLHRTHHTDIDVDVTTELRHHPLEAILVLLVNGLVVVGAGIAPETIIVSLALVIPVSTLSHGNWLLPEAVDRWLRLLLVTPNMHRIHHSAWQPETDSNYSVLFSFWDRLFHSYRQAPRATYGAMPLGLERFREHDSQILHRLLLNPVE
jgi:sterol desaturase/sphingolipid hydroxylase (fatty acid hydroxylase superfamily)